MVDLRSWRSRQRAIPRRCRLPAAALALSLRWLLLPVTSCPASLHLRWVVAAALPLHCLPQAGVGVLTLPQAIAWMGWVAGPLLLIAFYLVTLLSAHIISRLYMVDRIEFARYHHSVQYVLVRCSFPPG